MKYSLFVIVCLIIHLVINIDIFRRRPTVNLPAIKTYRIFVLSIATYFLVDLLWGVFDENKLPLALYIDTTIYFAVMGFTILAWMAYIVKFLETQKQMAFVLLGIGNAFFLAEIVLLIINIFVPVLFRVDFETCVYSTRKARDVMLYVQILLYASLVIYTAIYAFRSQASHRRKYITISLYSAIMLSTIIIQIYDPYLPIYSIGLIVGSTMLNSFVINDIKEEYKTKLAESRQLVKESEIQLSETKMIAYTDPLTNIKNKHAYVEEEERIDKLISQGEMSEFAVVVFDLNGLKIINDTKGHDAGDSYIVDACRTIERFFGNEHLYRFGGDEFVVILFDEAFNNRSKTLAEFEKYIDECLHTDKPIISHGMSKFRKENDNTYHAVFYRADKIMYARKDILKERRNN